MIFNSSKIIILATFLGGTSLAWAFPPAPTYTYHGTGRDSFGNGLANGANAVLLLKQGDKIIAQAPIAEGLHIGENFRIQAPIDLSEIDPYSPNAINPDDLTYFEVRFPNRTVPVTGIRTVVNQVGQPGDIIRFDFTIGVDSDGDRLPDDWERYQLDEAGLNPGDELYSLTTFGSGDYDQDGVSDFNEYIAGTFAFLNPDFFNLEIASISEEGNTLLNLDVKFGRKYRFETSADLKSWSSIPVATPAAPGTTVPEYQATEDGKINLLIFPEVEGGEAAKFIRASVR